MRRTRQTLISEFCEVYGDQMRFFLEILDGRDFLRIMMYFYVSNAISKKKPISVRRMCMLIGIGVSIGHYIKNHVCNSNQKVFGGSNTNEDDAFCESDHDTTFAS